MKMKTFIYLLIQTLVLGLWPWSCKDYVCLWNDCNNDLCFCVLHLKLWMLALIQGLALQSQGSFFLYKGGILQMVSEHCVACRIMTLGLETTKDKFSTSTLIYSSRKTFLIFFLISICR